MRNAFSSRRLKADYTIFLPVLTSACSRDLCVALLSEVKSQHVVLGAWCMQHLVLGQFITLCRQQVSLKCSQTETETETRLRSHSVSGLESTTCSTMHNFWSKKNFRLTFNIIIEIVLPQKRVTSPLARFFVPL